MVGDELLMQVGDYLPTAIDYQLQSLWLSDENEIPSYRH